MEKYIERLPSWAQGPAEILAAAAEGVWLRPGLCAWRRPSPTGPSSPWLPLLIIAVAVLGSFLGSQEEAQQEIVEGIESVLGPEVARIVDDILTSALGSTSTAYLIGGILLVWTASSLFLEMQRDLNDIFDVPHEEVAGIVAMVRLEASGSSGSSASAFSWWRPG